MADWSVLQWGKRTEHGRDTMKDVIQQTLDRIEQEQGVRILYAVESGSRAWGFASPDSDYDVRYIYVRPQADYLRIDQPRDTIEGPLDEVLDFSGWDVRKALKLLRKTNPSLMEWVHSPIVYRTTPAWQRLAENFPSFFDAKSSMYHYISMAYTNWTKHLAPEQVKLKKYLYVLRPLLCCRWLEERGTVPPIAFDDLCAAMLPRELEKSIADLLRRKKAAAEGELAPHIPELDAFIQEQIPCFQRVAETMPSRGRGSYEQVNALFLSVLADKG